MFAHGMYTITKFDKVETEFLFSIGQIIFAIIVIYLISKLFQKPPGNWKN